MIGSEELIEILGPRRHAKSVTYDEFVSASWTQSRADRAGDGEGPGGGGAGKKPSSGGSGPGDAAPVAEPGAAV